MVVNQQPQGSLGIQTALVLLVYFYFILYVQCLTGNTVDACKASYSDLWAWKAGSWGYRCSNVSNGGVGDMQRGLL